MRCPCHEMIAAQLEFLSERIAINKWHRSEEAHHDVGTKVATADYFEHHLFTDAAEFREKFCGGKDCYLISQRPTHE